MSEFENKNETTINQFTIPGKEKEGLIVSSDSDPGKELVDSLRIRNELYSDLLRNYIDLTRKRNDLKEIHKWVFFWVMNILIIVSCFCCFAYIFTRKPSDGVVSIIGAFSSLITALVAIPLIIANYLFNSKEDDNITNVILETEKHDFSELQLLKEHLAKAKDEAKEGNKDESVMRIIGQRYSGVPPVQPDQVNADLSSLNIKISGMGDDDDE